MTAPTQTSHATPFTGLAIERASRQCVALFERHDRLTKLVKWHGRTIASRFVKRPRAKRVALFKKVEPDLPASAVLPNVGPGATPAPKHIGKADISEKLPFLSLEDLTTGNNFVSLLVTRALHRLSDWAVFDLNECLSSHHAFTPPNVYMIIHGDNDIYGRIVTKDAGGSETWFADRNETIGASYGFLLQELQISIISFLIQSIENLMLDVDLSQPPETEAPLTLDDVISLSGRRLGEKYNLRGYSHPPRFSVDNVMQTLLARLSEAQDEVRLLRTDPTHFRMRFQEYFWHRLEGVRNKRTGVTESTDDVAVWDDTMRELVQGAYEAVGLWSLAMREVRTLLGILSDSDFKPESGKPLEDKYEHSLVVLEILLKSALSVRVQSLRDATHGCPGLRKVFVKDITGEGKQPVYLLDKEAARKEGSEGNFQDMLPLLNDLMDGSGVKARPIRRHSLLVIIDDLLTKDAQQRSRMSQRLMGLISDLFTGNSLLLEVAGHRPMHRPLLEEARLKEEGLAVAEIKPIWTRWKPKEVSTSHLTTIFQKWYELDEPKPSAKEDTKAQRALPAIWAAVDEHFKQTEGRTLIEIFEKVIPSGLFSTSPGVNTGALAGLEEAPSFTVPVKKKVLKVFNSLFILAWEDAKGAEVTWEDFKTGMRQIRFRVEPVIATEWRFTPTNESLWPEFPISIHEPFESTKLSWQQARTIAKRLYVHYGLLRSSFILSAD